MTTAHNLTALVNHKHNLSYAYYRELIYWHNTWRARNPDVLRRLGNSARGDCPDYLFEILPKIQSSKMPRIADFGCGPFSNLSFLHRNKMADIVGIDVLAREYQDMYAALDIEPPIPLVACSGERLTTDALGGQFDLTYVQNALDHTSAPTLTWLNLYRLTKVGGFLGHCHAVNEATHEHQDHLHQFDLRPNGEASLIIDNLKGKVYSLTEGLSLELHYSRRWTIRDNYEYFVQIYRKVGDSVASDLLLKALDDLKDAYLNRQRWTFELEHALISQSQLREHGLAYNLKQVEEHR